jgi:ATP-dependent DNA ligase
MERFQLKKKDKIQNFSNQRPVRYVVWDILFHKGWDLRELPLMKRRSILESVLQPNEESSRMMLPQHKEALINRQNPESETKQVPKPTAEEHEMILLPMMLTMVERNGKEFEVSKS